MGEGDTDWERAHLRVGIVWGRETPTGRGRISEGGSGVGVGDTDWERAHLRVE